MAKQRAVGLTERCFVTSLLSVVDRQAAVNDKESSLKYQYQHNSKDTVSSFPRSQKENYSRLCGGIHLSSFTQVKLQVSKQYVAVMSHLE